MMSEVDKLFDRQLEQWKTARDNYKALAGVRVKKLCVGGVTYLVQFNPARIVSSAAKVDKASLKARKCFLCAENRPKEQEGVAFGSHYQILVNPFPIFPFHLTVPEVEHTPQRIASRFGDMLDLADKLDTFTVFYNGPRCGASAPDHAHFQAGNRGFLPIEKEWLTHRTKLADIAGGTFWHLDIAPCSAMAVETTSKEAAEELFAAFLAAMPLKDEEEEPMMNILAWKEQTRWIVILFPREKHRPDCYFAEGDENILISPASVDMGGVFITPLEKDFEKIAADDIARILTEVCIPAPQLQVLEENIIKNLWKNR